MSTSETNAGTGNETASQAEVTQQPAQGGEQQAATQAEQQEVDLSGVLPQTPEEAEKIEKEGDAGESDKSANEAELEAPPFEPKLPEGFQVDQEAMSGFLDFIKDTKAKPEAAQKLVDTFIDQQQKAVAGYEREFMKRAAEQNAQWASECRSDPEFGGENYTASCNYVTAAIRRLTPPNEQAALVEAVRGMNIQNNPQLFRFFARAGKATAESAPALSDAQSPERELTAADKLFPKLPSARKY